MSSSTKEKYRILTNEDLYILILFINSKIPKRAFSPVKHSVQITYSSSDPANPIPAGTFVNWSKA